MGALCLGLSLLCAAPLLQEKEAPKPWMEMPDDPIGRLWASVGEDTLPWVPTGLPAAVPVGVPDDEADFPWKEWARALDQLTPRSPGTESEPGQATRREASAALIRFALEDRRAEDAFRWLRGLGADDPEALAGLLPTLFPGVPTDTELLPGGRIPPLKSGAVLRPQLPPEPHAPEGRGLSRRATCRGLVIGGATLDLVLKLDGSGVVAEFTHRDGPEVTFVVQLPSPAGKRLKSLYVDWDLQPLPEGADEASFDWAATPIQVTIQPQPTGEDSPGYAESYSLFARLDFLEGSIPTAPKAALPTALSEAGLDLILGAAERDPGLASQPWGAIADAWQTAAGVPVRAIYSSTQPVSGYLLGTAVHFHSASDPKLLRRQITGAIEDRRRRAHLRYR
ncbi:hypothetical protein Poly30_34110 [Planctomycetes bacterium Poly30]|uniref:Uncharacterized protein n=1 Tax=Saltatorellus ferox TaxID=2528018 RepID=A0A518EUV3_9BACT|nr:hypothetical protein Poly30_34110 [Planctomycetes bacterium Poly30]